MATTLEGAQKSVQREKFSFSYRESFSQWWAGLSSGQAEQHVLSLIPLLRPGSKTSASNGTTALEHHYEDAATKDLTDSYGPRQWYTGLVPLSDNRKDYFLNEFSVERPEDETQHNFVMLHGYGAGLGLFYKNFEPLSRRPHWKLYALDLLGMGRSGRPAFNIKAKSSDTKVEEVEDWFIDALEEWRVKRGIEKMTLLGHSFGAYMAVCYALKYPGHLEKLILASPVGIPEDRYAWGTSTSKTISTVQNEVLQTQQETTGKAESSPPGRPPLRVLPRLIASLWAGNFSPFGFVRTAGPFGPSLVSSWTTRRFSELPANEAKALHDYCYSLFRLPGSGDFALTYILAPGAYARSPLIRRVHGLGRQYLKNKPCSAAPKPSSLDSTTNAVQCRRETGIPIVFMYGDRDWMDKQGGPDSEARINAAKDKALEDATDEETRLEDGSAKTIIVPNAGHHLYLDNFEDFNRIIEQEMEDAERRARRMSEMTPL